MTLVRPDSEELGYSTYLAFARFRDLVLAVPPDLRLHDSEWDARQVVAHLVTVMRRYTARDFTDRAGLSDDASDLGSQNAAELAALEGIGMADLVALLDEEMNDYMARVAPSVGLGEQFPFHGMTSIDGAGARSNVIGELLVHGYDVARAAGRPWKLEAHDMLMVVNGALQVASAFVDAAATADVRASYLLAPRGGVPQFVTIDRGACEIRDRRRGDKVDAVIGGSATAMGLLLYGRISTAQAVMRGLRVTGGRRPWRALAMPSYFRPI